MKPMPGIQPELRDAIAARDSAMCGDIVYRTRPAAQNAPAGSAAWSRTFAVELVDSQGRLHDWFNGVVSAAVTVSDTSTAGTATVGSANLTFVNGVAIVTVNGNAAAWVAAETITVTLAAKTIFGASVAQKTHVLTVA